MLSPLPCGHEPWIGSKTGVEEPVEADGSKPIYDPEFGARPVKRAIQRLLLNDLSKAILAGSVSRDHDIRVDADGDHLTFA